MFISSTGRSKRTEHMPLERSINSSAARDSRKGLHPPSTVMLRHDIPPKNPSYKARYHLLTLRPLNQLAKI